MFLLNININIKYKLDRATKSDRRWCTVLPCNDFITATGDHSYTNENENKNSSSPSSSLNVCLNWLWPELPSHLYLHQMCEHSFLDNT